LDTVISTLEALFRELGTYDGKKDLLLKYKRKAVPADSMLEALSETSLLAKDSSTGQVKIKLEANIYDILKKKAQEIGPFDEDRLVKDMEGKVSERVGFADLFQNFKEDLQTKIGKGDCETHYNLGIAYREMSLHEDAIKEFDIAMEDPSLRYDCCFMKGQSLMDLDQPEEAIVTYTEGIALEGLDPERTLGLKYELALALLATGRKEEALHYFKEIYQSQRDYRDVVEHIRALENSPGL
jgi:tetratricopeptide (TPR) repeat protein